MKLSSLLLIFALLMTVILMGGCGPSNIAKVNGSVIARSDFDNGLEQGFGTSEGLITGKRVLDALITRRLVEEEAAQKGVVISDEEMKKAMDDFAKHIQQSYNVSLDDYLKQSCATLADAQLQVKFDALLKKLVVPDNEVKDYFDAHQKELATSEAITFYQMLLPSEEAAKAARTEVVEGKKDFAEVAKQKSVTGGPLHFSPGGILITLKKDQTVNDPDPKIKDRLFAMKPGETSQPIPLEISAPAMTGSQSGGTIKIWRLLYLVSHIPAEPATLENSTDSIRSQILMTKTYNGQLTEYISTLRAKAKLEIIDPKYAGLGEDYTKLAATAPKPNIPQQMPEQIPGQAPPGQAPGQAPGQQAPAPGQAPAGH